MSILFYSILFYILVYFCLLFQSKTDFVFEDLDTKTLKKTLVNISAVQVPDFKIPNGNMWDVFITNVYSWFSARLLDYNVRNLLLFHGILKII